MTCKEAFERSSADAELRDHLRSCPECAAQFELDARLRDAILAEPADTSAIDEEIFEIGHERVLLLGFTGSVGPIPQGLGDRAGLCIDICRQPSVTS